MTENPFLRASELPYQLPPFDQITEEHYLPAIEQGLVEHRREIDAIAADPAPPTVGNTLVALERSGELLRRVRPVFHNATAATSTPALAALEQQIAPKLAAHHDAIFLDAQLYERVRALYDARDQLERDDETEWLLERYHTDFVRAGALLPAAEQARLREINQETAGLMAEFTDRVRSDGNDLAVEVTDPAELVGLSEGALATAAEAGRERGVDAHLLTLLLPTSQPALASLQDRSLRARLHAASVSRGGRGNQHDTRELVRRLVTLRAERAALLGYPHHAAYQIADRTAGSVAAVTEMLARLTPAAVANAEAEAQQLQKLADESGDGTPIGPGDWPFYAERVRERDFEVDYAALREYFPLEQVLRDGVFYAASQLYGISFAERDDLPTYHPQVRVFEVFDVDGSPLGLFLADLFTRDAKRGGAWQSTFVGQSRLRDTKPVCLVNMNISRPPAGEPALLTVDEVKTLFHEFGHALHSLFSDVTYPRFAGTSVPRDFVEYPSQVNEVWMLWPEVVANYARHHRTGEQLPTDAVERLRTARRFNMGFETTEYLAASLLDLAWHQLSTEQAAAVTDVVEFEAAALAAAGVALPLVPPRYRSTYFAHIFATEGYSAGYYSYIWSEVLDADTVEWFVENGGLRRENGDWFRQRLLARAGGIDSMRAFRDFRGRDPRIEPLLERRGLR
ncbi:M3 family metallopeptidase [Natronosporangium hydrolyticum]|uniref:M3 family metallopeptidase n=1 Tax=Natronosporangium hydrolyticum TaxID=2811111 RepID=A0A895YFM5_9ACTN|nr:M3 family metallopeptidase [Natronosporangium hydrolyticum]QSB13346.1 M3 family metallopeptidase [Natronosporangium hydrolyticum]